MADIAYVCLSDMHLGEEDSVLTNLKQGSSDIDTRQPSAVLRQLVKCLKFLISRNPENMKPRLILNGDILELALCTTGEAAAAFDRFIELVMKKGSELFDNRIIYIPGNHDHHLWETASETQYVSYIRNSKKKHVDDPWHVTNMFVDKTPRPVESTLLTALVQRRFPEVVIEVAYPNFGLLNQDGSRCVAFHHGHFIDPLYRLITTLRTLAFANRREPSTIWGIEAENFAWIDFFWSMLGRSGGAGRDIELVYEKMQDPEQFKAFLYDLIDNLARKYDLPGWDPATKWTLKRMADLLLAKRAVILERRDVTCPLSPKIEEGLKWYVNGCLREQILGERTGNMPSQVTFAFGHTHKPFAQDLQTGQTPQWIDVYNTGGWVVESTDPYPLHGGAVLLVDRALNSTLVRMYNETEDPASSVVKVEESFHTGEAENPFYKQIAALVNPVAEPWSTFSSLVSQDIEVRRQNLHRRIHDKG